MLGWLHPGQTHQFHRHQGWRAKTDRLEAMTIARVLLSGQARAGYLPSERVARSRERVRFHPHLSDEAARSQTAIQALLVGLCPAFTQVFADPCLPSALWVLQASPQAQAVVEAGVASMYQVLRAQTPAHDGRPTARKLVDLARPSASSGPAVAGRASSLQVRWDQLEHPRANMARWEAEIEPRIAQDPGVKGLQQVPAFGPKTVAVLRAELGEVDRFARTEQVLAYAGLDVAIKASGLWKGKAQLSKGGRGWLRRVLSLAAVRSSHLENAACGASYRRLVARGLKKGSALMAGMRKRLAVAAHLLTHPEEDSDPSQVGAGAAVSAACRPDLAGISWSTLPLGQREGERVCLQVMVEGDRGLDKSYRFLRKRRSEKKLSVMPATISRKSQEASFDCLISCVQ